MGSPFKQYFTDPARAAEGIKLVIRDGSVTNYELTACSKTGRETVVSYNAATFHDREGKLQGVFAAARDITERKRFEETLQEKNIELENASMAKDRFLASMSHELRTPLNSIIGFTGTMMMGLPGPLTSEQDRQLKMVQSSAKHLLSLINDLLDLAKIESGRVDLSPEDFDGRGLLSEIADTLQPLALNKGLVLEVKLPKLPLIVRSDRRAVNQVLINLTNNAIKYTEKGRVCLELKQLAGNGDVVTEFTVVDTGVGISPEDQAKLFQAFRQVGNQRSEGTGLGLHLSRKLANMLGGEIQMESSPGKGSRFSLLLGGHHSARH